MTDKTTQATEQAAAEAPRKRTARRTAGAPAQPSAKPAASPATGSPKPRAASAATTPATTVDPVSAAAAAESDIDVRKRVVARQDAAREETVAVLADIARRYNVSAPGQAREALRSVIDELSPDDAQAVHRALLEANSVAPRTRRNPDDELAADWREGIYHYRHRMLRRNFEKQ